MRRSSRTGLSTTPSTSNLSLPVRHVFDPAAAFINSTWFGADHPMTSTGGYLAPPLLGVWATAPYFHNGSVPTLDGVLDSTARPTSWRRNPTTEYDSVAVGLAVVITPPAGTGIQRRKTFDTSLPGMSSAGHTFGDDLDAATRRDLIEYLKTL